MDLIHFRILVYMTTISLHIGNILYMNSCFTEETLKNEVVRNFYIVQFYFLTCWNFTFQTVHAVLALSSDILTLRKTSAEDHRLLKILAFLRDYFFSSLVWPCTCLVFSVFWVFFTYDRSLLYPKDIDIAISYTSNHIMHSWIAVAVVLELVTRPKVTPMSHKWRIPVYLGVEVVYIIVLFAVHEIEGIWVYPIFGLLRDTVFTWPFFGAVAVILTWYYYVQWYLNDFVWNCKRCVGKNK